MGHVCLINIRHSSAPLCRLFHVHEHSSPSRGQWSFDFPIRFRFHCQSIQFAHKILYGLWKWKHKNQIYDNNNSVCRTQERKKNDLGINIGLYFMRRKLEKPINSSGKIVGIVVVMVTMTSVFIALSSEPLFRQSLSPLPLQSMVLLTPRLVL